MAYVRGDRRSNEPLRRSHGRRLPGGASGGRPGRPACGVRVGRLGSARGARSPRPGENRDRPCARDAARRFGAGPGAPRPGARVSSFIRVDRGRAVLPPGPSRRSGPGAHLGRPLAHLHGAERRGGRAQVPARGRAAGGLGRCPGQAPRGRAVPPHRGAGRPRRRGEARRLQAGARRRAGRRAPGCRAAAAARPCRGSDRGRPRPAGERGDGQVLPQGVRGLPGRLRSASLPDPHLRGPRTHRRRARSRRRLLAARAGGPPRAPHVRPRPAAGRPRGRGDRRVPQDVRAGEGVLRGREHPRRPRLAPRAQPRPALDGLPAPGAHAAGRAAHARVARAARPRWTTASST